MAKKDIVKEELEKSTNKKVVKKKKKGEEASNEDVVIQDEIALSSSSSEEGISSGDEVAGSFWSENGWLIAGGTLQEFIFYFGVYFNFFFFNESFFEDLYNLEFNYKTVTFFFLIKLPLYVLY